LPDIRKKSVRACIVISDYGMIRKFRFLLFGEMPESAGAFLGRLCGKAKDRKGSGWLEILTERITGLWKSFPEKAV
jgi:hypothetical protein